MDTRLETFLKKLKNYKYAYNKNGKEQEAVIDEIRTYLMGEKPLEDSIDFIRKNLKGKKHFGTKSYFIFDRYASGILIMHWAKDYTGTEDDQRFRQLILALNPYETIRTMSYGTGKSCCNFKSMDHFDKFMKSLKEQFHIDEAYSYSWALGFFYGHYNCGSLRKEIFEKIVKELSERSDSTELLKKGLPYVEHNYLIGAYGEAYRITKDDYFKEQIRKHFGSRFDTFMKVNYKGHNKEDMMLIKNYIYGEESFENIQHLFLEEFLKGKCINSIEIYKNFWALDEEIRNKYLRIFYETEETSLIYYIWHELKISRGTLSKSMKSYIQLALDAEVDLYKIINFLGEGGTIYYDYCDSSKDEYKTGVRYLIKKGFNPISYIENFSADSKLFILSSIFESNHLNKEHIKEAISYIKDKSKKIRDLLTLNLSKVEYSLLEDSLNDFKTLLKAKKADMRFTTVSILVPHAGNAIVEEILRTQFEIETDPKVRSSLIEALKIDVRTLYLNENGEFDLFKYIEDASKGMKKKTLPIDYKTLTKIRYKNKNEYIEDEIMDYFLTSYMTSDELSINRDSLLISEYMNEEDIINFAKDVLDYFIEDGFNNKKKWIILLTSIHADYDLIQKLNKLILELASNSKQKMASYIVKALALNGSSRALILVDAIGRKFKYKSVKESAIEAFNIAAKELGYSMQELQDKIVPDLGFTGVDYKEYDYGSRKFRVYMNDNLQLEIEKEDGKLVKTLPKPNKDDNEEMVQKAKDDFKILKKELKNVVKSQSSRMESSLSDFRMWDLTAWNNLFMKNPIMYRLGKKLLWGQYEGNVLIKTFIYDDEIYDVYDEILELDEDKKISIVHPLELSEEEKASWKEIFEDNEIEELFPQIDRKVFICKKEEIKFIEDFKNEKVNDATLVNRISKRGWYKGSVTDGGGYHEFFKESSDLKIGAEVTVDEYLNTYDLGYEDVAIKMVEFYKAGTIERGSYVYDEIDAKRRIKPIDVPKRYYSEIIYDVYKVIEK